MVPHAFLLSPAYCGGRRARSLLRADSDLPLARRLQAGTLTLGEAFSFMSGLYFRGKLTYAIAFGRGCDGPTLVITPTRGLQRPDVLVDRAVIQEFASVDVDSDEPRYRRPLERDVSALASRLGDEARVVLLGSVASGRYVDVLTGILGSRLCYPPSFIGRGDMSRGGLLLRSAASTIELDYAVLDSSAPRHGPRPPKLEPVRRTHDVAAERIRAAFVHRGE